MTYRSTSSIIFFGGKNFGSAFFDLKRLDLFLLDPFLDGKSLVPANNARIEVEHGPSLGRCLIISP
jgi:hypothetical protein